MIATKKSEKPKALLIKIPDFVSLNCIFNAVPNKAHAIQPVSLINTLIKAIIILPIKLVPNAVPNTVIKISKWMKALPFTTWRIMPVFVPSLSLEKSGSSELKEKVILYDR